MAAFVYIPRGHKRPRAHTHGEMGGTCCTIERSENWIKSSPESAQKQETSRKVRGQNETEMWHCVRCRLLMLQSNVLLQGRGMRKLLLTVGTLLSTNTEATKSSETSVNFGQITRRHRRLYPSQSPCESTQYESLQLVSKEGAVRVIIGFVWLWVADYCEQDNKAWRTMKFWAFLYKLSECQLARRTVSQEPVLT